MKKSGENSKIDMRALFGGEPPEYEMRRARKLLGNGTALLSAEICYPHFTGAGGEAIDAFYSDVADGFFDFAGGEALGRAQTVYDADNDPRKRFRFRRFMLSAAFRPGFVSGGLISVGAVCTLTRGGAALGAWVGAQQWRVRDGVLLPFGACGNDGGTAAYFSADGRFVRLEASAGTVSESRENIDKSLTQFRMISKLFATIG